MSTLHVTAERLIVRPHPNATNLDLAAVGLCQAVVPAGRYITGDHAIYIPSSAILPPALLAELNLTGRLAGPKRDRVRPVRLRGELSEGIVCTPRAVQHADLAALSATRYNFADELGITKWVPSVPVHLSGRVVPAPELLRWHDIENLSRYPEIFVPGEPVVATEKIHGTACLTTWINGRVLVSSKGYGGKGLALAESLTNVYWRTIHAWRVPAALAAIAADCAAPRVGMFGEIFGHGVQDLTYGADASRDRPGYAVFDVAVEVAGKLRWLDPVELARLTHRLGLPAAPTLYSGPYDEAKLLSLASGLETVSGAGRHLREGLVIRPIVDRYSSVLRGRTIAKLVSGDYLTRAEGTEFE